MRINENTRLLGRKVVLVPYKKHHVEKYHVWMKDPELLEKTASEPLTLTEEYEMQDKWWKDEDKCTFIVLDKHLCEGYSVNNELEDNIDENIDDLRENVDNVSLENAKDDSNEKRKRVENEDVASMVGDVNLFFNNNFDDEEGEGKNIEAEVEVMIAEHSARGKGMGKEAVVTMLNYGYRHLSVRTFVVKIGDNNKESIHLFDKLGFRFVSHSEVFEETTFKLHTESRDFRENVLSVSTHVEMQKYV